MIELIHAEKALVLDFWSGQFWWSGRQRKSFFVIFDLTRHGYRYRTVGHASDHTVTTIRYRKKLLKISLSIIGNLASQQSVFQLFHVQASILMSSPVMEWCLKSPFYHLCFTIPMVFCTVGCYLDSVTSARGCPITGTQRNAYKLTKIWWMYRMTTIEMKLDMPGSKLCHYFPWLTMFQCDPCDSPRLFPAMYACHNLHMSIYTIKIIYHIIWHHAASNNKWFGTCQLTKNTNCHSRNTWWCTDPCDFPMSVPSQIHMPESPYLLLYNQDELLLTCNHAASNGEWSGDMSACQEYQLPHEEHMTVHWSMWFSHACSQPDIHARISTCPPVQSR